MIRFSNNVSTTLTTAVNSTQTQITVTDASKFPTLNEGDSTYCTLVDAFNAQWLEICEVTAISGNTLTVRRGIEGTSPRDFNVGAKCELRLTAELLTRAITEIQADRIDGNVTVIQLKRDDIDGLTPSPNANSFEVGELVYNTTTGDLWSKLDSGEITQLGGPNYIPDDAPYGGPQIYGRRNGEWTAIPFPSTFVSDVPPTILNPDDGSPVDMPTGSMWYDTGTTSELYVWDGMHWVSMTGVDSDSLEGALPDNVTTDDFQQQNIDKALVRIHPQSGKGYWRPVSTSDVNTEPDVTFRDEKGRFKSTKPYEELTDQLKVNRFLALELENQTETIAKEAEMRRTKDDQLQAEITALAEVVAGIDPDAEDPNKADKEYVDEQVGAESKMRREADSTLQSEIDALAKVVGEIDISEIGDLPEDIATQEFVTEEVAKEAEVRRLQDVSLQSQINALAGLENNTDLEGFATTEYVDEKVASEAEIRGLQDDRIEAKVTNLAESLSDEIKAREQGDVDAENNANSYTDEQVGAESSARRTADEGLQKEVEALANAVAAIEIPEIPEVDLTGYATEDFVTEAVGTESDTRRIADEGLQKEIDALAESVAAIDIPEIPEVDLTGYATEDFVTETVGAESDTRRIADEGLQKEIDTLADNLANIDFPDPDLSGYVTTEQFNTLADDSAATDNSLFKAIEEESIKTNVAVTALQVELNNVDKKSQEKDRDLQKQIDELDIPDGVDLGPVEDRLDSIEEVLPKAPIVIPPVDVGRQNTLIDYPSRPSGADKPPEGECWMWHMDADRTGNPANEMKTTVSSEYQGNVIIDGINTVWFKQGDRVQKWNTANGGWWTGGNLWHLSASSTEGDTLVDGQPFEIYYTDPNATGDDLIDAISRLESKADDRKLQAEIEVLSGQLSTLVKSQEDGEWKFVGAINFNVPRNAGEFALLTDQLTSESNAVVLREEDLNGITHNFNAPVGSYIEIVDEEDPSDFVLFEVTREPDGDGLIQIDTKLVKAGNPFEIDDRCIIRFFEVGEGLDINELDTRYLQLAGGTMKGDLKFDGPRQITYVDENGQGWNQFRFGSTTEYVGQYGASDYAIATRKRVEEAVAGLASEEWVTEQIEGIEIPDVSGDYATEEYVDQKVYQSKFLPGQQVAKTDGSSSNTTGAFWIVDGALYCKV